MAGAAPARAPRELGADRGAHGLPARALRSRPHSREGCCFSRPEGDAKRHRGLFTPPPAARVDRAGSPRRRRRVGHPAPPLFAQSSVLLLLVFPSGSVSSQPSRAFLVRGFGGTAAGRFVCCVYSGELVLGVLLRVSVVGAFGS